MCYITSRQEKKKIAEHDITVYKLLVWNGTNYLPAYNPKAGFTYEVGKEYKTIIRKNRDMSSFDGADTLNICSIPFNERVSYGCGFHSCKFSSRAHPLQNDIDIIAEFVIPEGSKYMYRDGLYISNRIRFVGVFTPTE